MRSLTRQSLAARSTALAIIVLACAAPGIAQRPSSVGDWPSAAITVGIGFSYGIFGALGEVFLGQPRISATAGVGYFEGVAVSGGVRAYKGLDRKRPYVEAIALSWRPKDEDSWTFMALVVGYSSVTSRGSTFNIGAGPMVSVVHKEGSQRLERRGGIALNIGIGNTWRSRRRTDIP